MKFALLLLLFLAFALVESFEEREFLEDENDPGQRHIFKQCKEDADCGDGKCCLKNFLFHKCKAKGKEGKLCLPNSSCFFSCQDDLECRKTDNGFFSVHKCMRPEEPGSGEDNF